MNNPVLCLCLARCSRTGRPRARWFSTLMLLLALWLTPVVVLNAQETAAPDLSEPLKFRVDNVVQMEKNDEILEIKTSTVFADGLVFDFIGDYGEIIIYRPEQQIFTLLDPLHRLQTELSCSEIDSFLANIRDRLLAKKDKFQAFVLNPSFDISASEDESELILQSKWLEYTLKTKLFEEEQLSQAYFLFSNAYCKLNIYLNPGSTTPFARMEVNRILEERSRFPDEFHLTIWPKGKWFLGRTIKIESRHTLVRRLSERDEGRLVRALHFSRQFPKVSFTDYQKSLK